MCLTVHSSPHHGWRQPRLGILPSQSLSHPNHQRDLVPLQWEWGVDMTHLGP